MLKIAWSPHYIHPLPEGHRFPMDKYRLLPEKLIHQGIVSPGCFFTPGLCIDDDLVRVHTPEYIEKLKNLKLSKREERLTGFPVSNELVYRERIITQGTIDCCAFALENGAAMNIAGGTHHAFADHGEGFCLFNDIGVSSCWLLANKKVKKILVIDLDVHQGNGTAAIFKNNQNVFTFSMHGHHNYPLQKEESDLDIPLPDKTTDDEYLEILIRNLTGIVEEFKPEFIHYQAGVDVLSSDKLGKLSLTISGCRQRDIEVISAAKKYGLPLVCTMGGGYSSDIQVIVEAHKNTFEVVHDNLIK